MSKVDSGGQVWTERPIREKDSTETVTVSGMSFSRHFTKALIYMDINRHERSQLRRLTIRSVGCLADAQQPPAGPDPDGMKQARRDRAAHGFFGTVVESGDLLNGQ